ncbi:unnamed protein product [Gongylonema pulchrum]|uniref:Uncharacterized protein n=1 Tax=Gongylonema pulchrum TaxID=637853 RepID=A0A183E7E4_9BILA|nr:unnamed protein product [Gongylonema pulchrum]
MCGIEEVIPPVHASRAAPVSLLVSQKLTQFEPSEPVCGGFVSWCPALQNWSPWKAANIDEPPYAFVCQYLLEDYINKGRGAEFAAFVTQPRRISAITLAERVADERGEQLGVSVGYGVRFDLHIALRYDTFTHQPWHIFCSKKKKTVDALIFKAFDAKVLFLENVEK